METLLVLHRRRGSSGSNSINWKTEDAVLKAALDGDLAGFKGIIKSLGVGNADGAAIFSINKDDFGVLHCAAREGHQLEVCRYLVEELGGDVNMPAAEGVTPFMASVEKGDVSIVNYFLDHGTWLGGQVASPRDKEGYPGITINPKLTTSRVALYISIRQHPLAVVAFVVLAPRMERLDNSGEISPCGRNAGKCFDWSSSCR